jgi:hypothetical protein
MEIKIYNKLIWILVIVLFPTAFFGQSTPTQNPQVTQIQPTVIVIPYKKEGQKYRQLIEDPMKGFQRRLAISRVKEAFDGKGFTTYDFIAELTKSEASGAFTTNSQTDEKDVIVKNSGADIFVTVDIDFQPSSSGNEVKIILQAYESATARSLTNKDAASGKFYTDDISKLAGKAIDNMKEDFLNVLQTKFSDIVSNGRSIYMEFVLEQNSSLKFNSEIGTDGDLLSEAIGDWLKKNSYKNYAKKGGSSTLKMIYDDVRLPLKTIEGNNYDIELDFGRQLRKFLKSINANATIEYPRGQIIVTIN